MNHSWGVFSCAPPVNHQHAWRAYVRPHPYTSVQACIADRKIQHHSASIEKPDCLSLTLPTRITHFHLTLNEDHPFSCGQQHCHRNPFSLPPLHGDDTSSSAS